MAAEHPSHGGSRWGERACNLLRPVCRLPGLRRSLPAQLVTAALMLVLGPAAMAAWAVHTAGLGTGVGLAIVAAALAAGALAFWGAARCLMAPVRQLTRMVHAYRVGDTLEPPEQVQYDEVGALVGETMQTLREANAHLARRARRDATTGALNRDGLDAELEFLLHRGGDSASVALALIEVRDLGRWEIALGADTVQSVRRVVVERLRALAPEAGAVAALGPHWFAFAVQEPPEAVEQRLATLWERLRSPIPCGERTLNPSCAVGIARAEGNESAVGLFHAAETALIAARKQGGSARVEAAETSARLHDAAALGLALEEAIDTGAIEARFQPRVDAGTGAWQGAEALARWTDPVHGPVSPATFIPLAYSSGRIVALGRVMLDRAVAAAARWRAAGGDRVVSVNIDAEHLTAATLDSDVMASLERHGLPAERLELEITEASLLAELDSATEQIVRLRERGVRFALDDFGTGYSSLGYLGRLPIDRIKIDRSFVAELATAEGTRIVRAIADLARSLSMTTTAEGVETERQAGQLAELGCDEFQGFLYAGALEWSALMPGPEAEDGNRADASLSG